MISRIIFNIWIIEVTKRVHHSSLVCALYYFLKIFNIEVTKEVHHSSLVCALYYFLKIFTIEFIQEFKCLENRLVRLGRLESMTGYLTINGIKYSTVDQVNFVEDSLYKI